MIINVNVKEKEFDDFLDDINELVNFIGKYVDNSIKFDNIRNVINKLRDAEINTEGLMDSETGREVNDFLNNWP